MNQINASEPYCKGSLLMCVDENFRTTGKGKQEKVRFIANIMEDYKVIVKLSSE